MLPSAMPQQNLSRLNTRKLTGFYFIANHDQTFEAILYMLVFQILRISISTPWLHSSVTDKQRVASLSPEGWLLLLELAGGLISVHHSHAVYRRALELLSESAVCLY